VPRPAEPEPAPSDGQAGDTGPSPPLPWLWKLSALRALRHRDYQLFLAGQFVSMIGTWMQSIAQSWLVYRLTGSEVQLGLIGFAGQFPVFLLAPLGGSLADTHDRHRIVVATQAAAMVLAFLLAGLTLTGQVRLWHVFVVATVGEGWCFFANGLSFFAVLAGLLAMNRSRRPSLARPEGRSALAHVTEGLTYSARTAPIRALMLMLALASLMGMSFTVLMPVFADQILHVGAKGLGLLTGASGVGALLGALTVAARSSMRGMGRLVWMSAAAFGLSLVAFSASRSFWLSSALMVPTGYALMVEMATVNSLIQAMVPDRLRGRVMAVYSMMLMGMAPFGALISGFLAQAFGAPAAVRIGGFACIAGAAVFGVRWPSYRVQARDLIVAQAAASEPSAS
jgi:MFS family permease